MAVRANLRTIGAPWSRAGMDRLGGVLRQRIAGPAAREQDQVIGDASSVMEPREFDRSPRRLRAAIETVSSDFWETESVSVQNTEAVNQKYGSCSSPTVTALSSKIHGGVLPDAYRRG